MPATREHIAGRFKMIVATISDMPKDEKLSPELVSAFWGSFVEFFDEFVAGEIEGEIRAGGVTLYTIKPIIDKE